MNAEVAVDFGTRVSGAHLAVKEAPVVVAEKAALFKFKGSAGKATEKTGRPRETRNHREMCRVDGSFELAGEILERELRRKL
jgi:hypothetical protein